MKLIDNIAGFNAIAGAVLSVGKYRKTIDAAREAGDFDMEREEIIKATSEWGSKVVKYFQADVNIINPQNLPEVLDLRLFSLQ